ncbi:UNVERIFIED_ORG: hypothetical protein GGD48_004904 [Rhizobium etli]
MISANVHSPSLEAEDHLPSAGWQFRRKMESIRPTSRKTPKDGRTLFVRLASYR